LSYSIREPSLKLVSLPVPKIRLIFRHSIYPFDDLDLWPLWSLVTVVRTAKSSGILGLRRSVDQSDLSYRLTCNTGQIQPSTTSFIVITMVTKLITVGDRAFPVAGNRLWDSLPHVVTSAPTLAVFRNRLKTYLFSRSFTHWLTLIHCLVV